MMTSEMQNLQKLSTGNVFVKPKGFVAVYKNNITLTPSTKNITTFILTFAIKTLKSFWTTPYLSQFNPSFFVETQT